MVKTIAGLFFAFLVVIGIAFISGDKTLIIIILVGELLLLAPFFLLYRGHLRLSSFLLVLLIVIVMTVSAVMGQGIHDVAIMTYPVAIFFANLVLQRRDFFWLSSLVFLAVGGLGVGEALGWFIPKAYNPLGSVDFIIAEVILLVAIMIADSLAENIRKSMHLAQKEIALRKKTQEKLRHLNIHDELTGIYNRSFFDEVLMLLEQSKEYPVSIIFADLDNLKEVNDKNGHIVGDALLKRTSETVSTAFRTSDILARIGGDEFAVILPQTDSATAQIILSRLRAILSKHNAEHPDLPIHISLGTSTAKEGGLKKAVMIADRRMYNEKKNRKLKK